MIILSFYSKANIVLKIKLEDFFAILICYGSIGTLVPRIILYRFFALKMSVETTLLFLLGRQGAGHLTEIDEVLALAWQAARRHTLMASAGGS